MEGFAAVATFDEILAKGNALAISQYVVPAADAVKLPENRIEVALDDWRAAASAADSANAAVVALIRSEAVA